MFAHISVTLTESECALVLQSKIAIHFALYTYTFQIEVKWGQLDIKKLETFAHFPTETFSLNFQTKLFSEWSFLQPAGDYLSSVILDFIEKTNTDVHR